MQLESLIESILFFKGEPVSLEKLAELTGSDSESITTAVQTLEEKMMGRGIVLIRKENEVMLGTSPAASTIVEKMIKEDLVRDLGKAGLETLSIIIYRGPIARREIDYIRGVNSNFILRNLLVRGLIEKVQAEKDQRQFLYKPTFELLQYMGISKIEELPEYSAVRQEIEKFKQQSDEQKTIEEPTIDNAPQTEPPHDTH